MITLRLYAICAVLVMTGFAATFLLQGGLDRERSGRGGVKEFMYLPDAGYIQVASLGYDSLSADLIWLKAIQTLGKFRMSPEEYDWSYKALDTLTTLDPHFVEAYELGGLILTLNEEKADLANMLLEKGVRYNPDIWQLHYYLGFNYYYFLNDYERASVALSLAADMEGSPGYLPQLASRVAASAGKFEFAIEFIQRMYDQVDDERLKEMYLKRINELKSAYMAKEIQAVVDQYRDATGREPTSLSSLVNEGVLKGIPPDPVGGEFYIDEGGTVRSTVLKDSMNVFRNR